MGDEASGVERPVPTVRSRLRTAACCAVVAVAAHVSWRVMAPMHDVGATRGNGISAHPVIYCCSMAGWQVHLLPLFATSAVVALVVAALRRWVDPPGVRWAVALTCVAVSGARVVFHVLLPAVGSPIEIVLEQPAIVLWWLGWLVLPVAATAFPWGRHRKPDPAQGVSGQAGESGSGAHTRGGWRGWRP